MSEPNASAGPTRWRVVGLRRWVPLIAVAGFFGNGADDVAHLVLGDLSPSDPRSLELVLAVLGAVGFVAAVVVTVVGWRTCVTLTPTGVQIRAARQRSVAYSDITRVYRDRFTPASITLRLVDERTVRLPAPVAVLGVASSTVDEAVEQIRARLPSPTPG